MTSPTTSLVEDIVGWNTLISRSRVPNPCPCFPQAIKRITSYYALKCSHLAGKLSFLLTLHPSHDSLTFLFSASKSFSPSPFLVTKSQLELLDTWSLSFNVINSIISTTCTYLAHQIQNPSMPHGHCSLVTAWWFLQTSSEFYSWWQIRQ